MSSAEPTFPDDLIRGWNGITAEVHKGRHQLRRDIKAGKFPAPIELGPNSLAWRRQEVEAWKAARPRRTYQSRPPQPQHAA
jgi:predicted DNA-binding transcriptional regulator AlpA